MNVKRKKIYKHLDDLDMVKAIVEAGGINRVEKKTGRNALFFALSDEIDIQIMSYLLANGIDVNRQDKAGNTVLHLCEDMDKLKLILSYAPNLNLKNKLSRTPIFGCNDHTRAMLLVEAGIDLNVVDDKGQHFLKSVKTMDFDLMKIFIDRGLNRFIEKRGLTLDTFFEEWSSIETLAYFENKLKMHPEKYRVKV